MKKSKILPLMLTALLLTSCSLARAEEAPPGSAADRFIGFYMIHTGSVMEFYNNPYLEEYGTFTAESGRFGTVGIPREVLFAAEDAAGNLVFPGMEGGYSLFCYETEEEYGRVTHMVSTMAPGETMNSITETDEGTARSLSGTVYFGPPLNAGNWDPNESTGVWHCCRVYQTADERVYLDGEGNSFSGGGFGYSETQTYTTTQNGGSAADTMEVSVRIEIVSRLERLVVTQFDEASAILRSDDLALRDDLPEITPDPAAAWILIEEITPDSTTRTVYNVPSADEDPVYHSVILLDDDGLGRLASLTIR